MHADPKGVLTGVHFLDGDHACCEGALAAGARFSAGYPITPSTEVVERFASRIPTVGGIFIQMEDDDTVYVVPIKSDSEHFPPEGKLRVYRSRTGGNEWEPLTQGLPQRDCYVNVLREAMAVDSLDECGVYFGTTGGQVYASAVAGDHWASIVRDLPAVLSVEVQTLA